MGALAIVGLCGGIARADDDDGKKMTWVDGVAAQDARGIEVGAIYEGGRSEYSAGGLEPIAQGLVIRDRNGTTSRMVLGLVVAIAGAMAENGPKEIKQKQYRSGDYIVTETETTYYSEAEKAQIRQNTSDSIDALFGARYADMELRLYSKDRFERGDTSGYKANFMAGDAKGAFAFETGFGFGEVDSNLETNGMPAHIHWRYFGMPFRGSVAAGPVRLALTWEWNWLKYDTDKAARTLHMAPDGQTLDITASTHAWHLDASTLLLKRVYVMGGVTTQEIRNPKLGYYASAGFMF